MGVKTKRQSRRLPVRIDFDYIRIDRQGKPELSLQRRKTEAARGAPGKAGFAVSVGEEN